MKDVKEDSVKLKDQDFIAGGLLVVFSLLGFFFSFQLVALQVNKLSAAFFPNFIFSVILVCGLILMKQGFQKEKKIPFPRLNYPNLLPVIGLLLAYVFIMDYLGFIISTIIFLFCSIYVFGERRKNILASVPIIVALSVYYLFSKVFMIIMPEAAFL